MLSHNDIQTLGIYVGYILSYYPGQSMSLAKMETTLMLYNDCQNIMANYKENMGFDIISGINIMSKQNIMESFWSDFFTHSDQFDYCGSLDKCRYTGPLHTVRIYFARHTHVYENIDLLINGLNILRDMRIVLYIVFKFILTDSKILSLDYIWQMFNISWPETMFTDANISKDRIIYQRGDLIRMLKTCPKYFGIIRHRNYSEIKLLCDDWKDIIDRIMYLYTYCNKLLYIVMLQANSLGDFGIQLDVILLLSKLSLEYTYQSLLFI